jgi:Uma2 family endonuclease
MSAIQDLPDVIAPRPSRRGEPVWELARQYPTQGRWTEEQFLLLNLEERVELSEGCLEFLPMGSYLHEAIASYLAELLREFTRQHAPGKVFSGRLPIRLWSGQMREPDVVYLTRERIEHLRADQFESQPDGADLVMEVVSPGDEARERDYVTKRQLYAQAGIAEYWIVDPHRALVTLLVRRDAEYQQVGEFGRGTTVESVLLPGFRVAVDTIFAAAEPDGGP